MTVVATVSFRIEWEAPPHPRPDSKSLNNSNFDGIEPSTLYPIYVPWQQSSVFRLTKYFLNLTLLSWKKLISNCMNNSQQSMYVRITCKAFLYSKSSLVLKLWDSSESYRGLLICGWLAPQPQSFYFTAFGVGLSTGISNKIPGDTEFLCNLTPFACPTLIISVFTIITKRSMLYSSY